MNDLTETATLTMSIDGLTYEELANMEAIGMQEVTCIPVIPGDVRAWAMQPRIKKPAARAKQTPPPRFLTGTRLHSKIVEN